MKTKIANYLKQHWKVLTARAVMVAVVTTLAGAGLGLMAGSLVFSILDWIPATVCGAGLLGGAVLVLIAAVATMQIAREAGRDAVTAPAASPSSRGPSPAGQGG